VRHRLGRPAALILAAIATLVPVHAQRRGAGAVAARPVVITGVTVIDGTGAPPSPGTTIVIEGAKITRMGPTATVSVPAGARVIDGAGKYVIPGLIDSGVHWRGWSGELFLNHGVTSIVDLGDRTDWILAARDAEIAGRLRGPRIWTSAGTLAPARAGTTAPRYASAIAGAADARKAARSLLEKGADALAVSGELGAEELRAAVAEAHKIDIRVVSLGGDAAAAGAAGVDSIAHVGWLRGVRSGDEAAAPPSGKPTAYVHSGLVADFAGVAAQARDFERADYELLMRPALRYVPLDAVLASLTSWRTMPAGPSALGPYPDLASAPAAAVDEARRSYRRAQDFIRQFAAAGGGVIAATDAGESAAIPGASLHHELELLVAAGLTPVQAIASATRVAAEFIGKDYKLGTVAVGKLADLVVLDADPVADIKNIRAVHLVVKNGEVIEPAYHRDFFTEYAEPPGESAPAAAAARPVLTELLTPTLNQNSQVLHDASPFDVIVKGREFRSTSLVHLNGRPLDTTFVGPGELRARIPTERLPVAGTYLVTVVTPWPGGGTSNTLGLTAK
jgi:imidazolonepropionase-like amidohydrolase